MILAVTVCPANEPEHKAAEALRTDIENKYLLAEYHIDRGYLASTWIKDLAQQQAVSIYAEPWKNGKQAFYSKEDFVIHLEKSEVICPQK